jgi:hypothetical protein
VLTNPAPDPMAGIPELKVCAVRPEGATDLGASSGQGIVK